MAWSGRTSLHQHKFEDWEDHPVGPDARQGVRKVWLLDAQWSTCPVEVENQVKAIWRYQQLGNDNCIYKTSIQELLEDSTPSEPVSAKSDLEDEDDDVLSSFPEVDLIVQYLREMGVQDKDQVLIHWWW